MTPLFALQFEADGAGPRLAVIAIHRTDEPEQRLRPDDLGRIEAVLDAIEGERDAAAIVIESGRPGLFLSGLDLQALALVRDRRDIEAFVRRGQALLDRLDRSSRPVVLAVDGPCLGVGVELSLVSDAVVASDRAHTRFGIPAIRYGLFPATGGLARLPRRIGLRPALDLLLSGRELDALEAQELGLVDKVIAAEALPQLVRDLARRLAAALPGRRPSSRGLLRRLVDEHPLAWRLTLREARRVVEVQRAGLDPAALAILDLLHRGRGRTLSRALGLEPPAFAELAVGETAQAKIHVALAAERLRQRPFTGEDGAIVDASPPASIGIVGGGAIGADLAVVAARTGAWVRLREKGTLQLGRALGRMREQLDRRPTLGVDRVAARLSSGIGFEGFDRLDLVIEAVPEDLALKERVFADLEASTSPHAVLASHTRALSITRLAARVADPGRVVGLHLFRPVAAMPLCEIVRTDASSGHALATALAFARALGKTPIVVRDAPGFYTTRVMGFYLMAAVELVQAGHAVEDVDEGARRVGWPVGPLALLDAIGLEEGASVARVLADTFASRMAAFTVPDAMLAAGRSGRAHGRGFYVYPRPGVRRPDPELRERLGWSARPKHAPPEQLGDRLTLVAALEAVRCLEEGVIAGPSEGDVGAVLGLGYPAHRGGPFRHLGARGLTAVRHRLAALEARFGARFSPPDLLCELAASGRDFYDLEAS